MTNLQLGLDPRDFRKALWRFDFINLVSCAVPQTFAYLSFLCSSALIVLRM